MAAAQALLALDPGTDVDALVNSRRRRPAHLGRLEAAVAAYDEALAIAPAHLEAAARRGSAERDLGRLDDALDSFGKVVALAPEDVEALYEQGAVAAPRSRTARPWPVSRMRWRFRRPMAMCSPAPHSPPSGSAIGQEPSAGATKSSCASKSKAGIAFRAAGLAGFGGNACMPSPPGISFRDKVRISARPPSAADRRREKIRRRLCGGRRFRRRRPDCGAGRRHDRTRFDVVGVSTGRAADSEALRAARSVPFDQYHDVTTRPDAAAARLLREIEVDIAVVIEGYAEDGRFGIFAARPAPIQVNFGYPATMGAEFVDYIIADRTVLPFDQQKVVTEKIVQLPAIASRRADDRPGTGTRSCHPARRPGCPRPDSSFFALLCRRASRSPGRCSTCGCGCCHAPRAACCGCRREAMRRASSCAAKRRHAGSIRPGFDVEHYFAAGGRLLLPRLADLFLDTLPFNAAAAADALWAGVPVVTCKGNAFAARIGASLDTAAGQSDLIAPDLAAYEALALRLAAEPERLADCKRRLAGCSAWPRPCS